MVFHYETAAVSITFVEQTQHYNQASACFPALYIQQRFCCTFLVFSIGFCVYKGPEMIFRTYPPYGTRKPSMLNLSHKGYRIVSFQNINIFLENTKLPSKCCYRTISTSVQLCSNFYQSSAHANFNYQKYTNKQQISFASSKC